MRRYETVFILNPDLSEEQHKPLYDKLTGIVSDAQGKLVKLDEWGHKRLAYEVKKQTRGYYVLMDLCGDGALVKEIERNLRLDDRVLKYMTILKDESVDLQALEAEIEAAKEEKTKLEPAPQAEGEAVNEDKPTAEAVEPAKSEEEKEDVSRPEEAGDSESPAEAEVPATETQASENTDETRGQKG
jgi:small subunit ribosomal protein S6